MIEVLSDLSTDYSFPLVVWGGGTGGLAAAVQAARLGTKTLLLTPGPWLGGMVSAAGVSAPDGHELSCWQTGLWGAFLRDIAKVEPDGLDHNWVSCFGFHPRRAEQVLQRWVADCPQLDWWPNVSLKSISRDQNRIQSIEIEISKRIKKLRLDLLIDGSDLGDTFPLTQTPHRWGWEPKELWKEPSAPSAQRLLHESFFSKQPIQSPTWVVMGQLDESRQPPNDSPDLPDPFTEATKAFGFERTLTYGRLPGGLVMLNWPIHGNDWHQQLERLRSPQAWLRDQLSESMQSHSLAFLKSLKQVSNGWLRSGNAFPGANPSLALMPYWREGRRLIGHNTVVENDLLPLSLGPSRGPLPFDEKGSCTSIAVGTYANDHHYPGEDWPLAPKSCRWGGRWTGTPFCIPYGAIISSEIENLLVADKAFSVSHIANGATRLQPLIFNIGQAAGIAAAQALNKHVMPADLEVGEIQQALLNDRFAPAAVLPIWDWPAWHPSWRSAQEMVLKNPDCLNKNGIIESNKLKNFVGELPLPNQTPASSQAKEFQGTLRTAYDGQYSLELSNEQWPLITLEPALNTWLQSCKDGEHVCLLAVKNKWGPWLRVTSLLS